MLDKVAITIFELLSKKINDFECKIFEKQDFSGELLKINSESIRESGKIFHPKSNFWELTIMKCKLRKIIRELNMKVCGQLSSEKDISKIENLAHAECSAFRFANIFVYRKLLGVCGRNVKQKIAAQNA